eukprot:GEMP01003217.1.p1 GENE.GEMP01003217.1~~GEMP01003217.1.p1  ORF type:complete len:928 (-),score=206.53 GEMP01003217.1:1543-4326(-)
MLRDVSLAASLQSQASPTAPQSHESPAGVTPQIESLRPSTFLTSSLIASQGSPTTAAGEFEHMGTVAARAEESRKTSCESPRSDNIIQQSQTIQLPGISIQQSHVNAVSGEQSKTCSGISSPQPLQPADHFPSSELQAADLQAPVLDGRPSTGASPPSRSTQKSPTDGAPPEKVTEELLKVPFVIVKNFSGGLECINGTYSQGHFYCNRPTFVKNTAGDPFCLYYRNLLSDGSGDIAGWWFGPTIFSEGVWAHHTSPSFLPPERNWSAPSCAGGEISHQNPSGPRVYLVRTAERAQELSVPPCEMKLAVDLGMAADKRAVALGLPALELPPQNAEVPQISQVETPAPQGSPHSHNHDSPRLRLSLSHHVTCHPAAKQAVKRHPHDPPRQIPVPPRVPTPVITGMPWSKAPTTTKACPSSHHSLIRNSPPHSTAPSAKKKATSSKMAPGLPLIPVPPGCPTPRSFQPPLPPLHSEPFRDGAPACQSCPSSSVSHMTPRDSDKEQAPRRPAKRRRPRRGPFESDDDSSNDNDGPSSPRFGMEYTNDSARASGTCRSTSSKSTAPCPRPPNRVLLNRGNAAHNTAFCNADSNHEPASHGASHKEPCDAHTRDARTRVRKTAATSALVCDDCTINSSVHAAASRQTAPNPADIPDEQWRANPSTAASSHEPAGLASAWESMSVSDFRDIQREQADWLLAQAMQNEMLDDDDDDDPASASASRQRLKRKRLEVICVNSDDSSDDEVAPPPRECEPECERELQRERVRERKRERERERKRARELEREGVRERKRARELERERKRALARSRPSTKRPSSSPAPAATTQVPVEASQTLALACVPENDALKCWACKAPMQITHNFCVSCGKPRNKDDDEKKPTAKECVVCLDLPRSCVFNPCGHFACCDACSKNFKKNKCPICRKKVITVLRLFNA